MKNSAIAAAVLLALTPAISAAQTDLTIPQQLNISKSNSSSKKENTRYIVTFKQSKNSAGRSANSTHAAHSSSVFGKQGFSADKANDLVQQLGGQIKRNLKSISAVAAELSPGQLKQLQNNPEVLSAELDPLRTSQAATTPYGISMVQADLLSDGAIGNQKVCIIDTGYDINHEDLMSGANVTGEVSNTLTASVDLGEWSTDVYGHGTHVAGTISSLNNSVGTEGVSPNGKLNLHIVKVIHRANYWEYWGSDVIAAVERCQIAGSTVINMSMAGTSASVAEEAAIDAAYNSGVLLVAAAGNRGSSSYHYPASYDSVISVGAVDDTSAAWVYTQKNDQVELVAPGVGIESTLPNNRYGKMDGTSASTPYVAGVAALVWSHHPECNNTEIRNVLTQTATDLGDAARDDTYGYGLVQAKAALDLLDEGGCDGILNSPPFINDVPPRTATEGVFYVHLPDMGDPDDLAGRNDIGTPSIINKPAWINFDPLSAELVGLPTNDDVGVYNDIEIILTDSHGATATTGAFTIEVFNVNDAPVISTVPENTVAQDGNYQYIVAADDIDLNSTLTYSAPTLPSWMTFNPSTKTLSGTPSNENVGSHSVELQVSDGTAIVTQAFSLEVTNVNDAPAISGTPANSVNENRSYTFTPTVTDLDGDSLTYSITGQPGWATFNTTSGQLSGTPGGTGAASFDGIVLTVDDGNLTDQLTFSITVVPSVYSQWTDSGGGSDHQTWTPAAHSQIADFSQSRGFKQAQTRTEQQQELSGSTVVNVGGLITHNRTIDETENRSVIVNAGVWSKVAAVYECSEWSPTTDTVDFGQAYTQSRDCKQDQQRTWGYDVDSVPVHSRVEANTITVNESQAATGTKQNWVSTTSTFTAWANEGNRYDYSVWAPAPSTQTAHFDQLRSYSQNQFRMEQLREIDTISNQVRDAGAAIKRTQTISDNEDRGVLALAQAWADSGAVYQCNAWSPAADTIDNGTNFNQNRSCQQNQDRTWSYETGLTVLHTRVESKAITVNESQAVVGTKVIEGIWSNATSLGRSGCTHDVEAAIAVHPIGSASSGACATPGVTVQWSQVLTYNGYCVNDQDDSYDRYDIGYFEQTCE